MSFSRIVRQLCLCLAGLACVAAGAWAAPAAAVTVRSPGTRWPKAASSVLQRGLPAVFFGDWLIPGKAIALGAFSAASGKLERIIAPPEGGGGVGQLALAPGGKAIAFEAGRYMCGSLIESVATKGGPVKVLVPDRPQHGGTPAIGPSYSPDGRYFSYGTFYCNNSVSFLHIRDLRTGQSRVYKTRDGITGLTFIDNDRRAVFVNDWRLIVADLPALTTRTYSPPAGCRYYDIASTKTKLVAAMDCGKKLKSSLVTLSTTTFRDIGTPIRLGSCKAPDSLSIAPGDPALLVEVTLGCHNGPRTDPNAALLEIRGTAIHQLLSGKYTYLPGNSVW
jgi:hypothetical protein